MRHEGGRRAFENDLFSHEELTFKINRLLSGRLPHVGQVSVGSMHRSRMIDARLKDPRRRPEADAAAFAKGIEQVGGGLTPLLSNPIVANSHVDQFT
jgi:hypothetical protein